MLCANFEVLTYVLLKFQDVWGLTWSDGKYLLMFRKIIVPLSLRASSLRTEFESEVGNTPMDFIKSWDFIIKRDIKKSSNNSIAELVGDRECHQHDDCHKTKVTVHQVRITHRRSQI